MQCYRATGLVADGAEASMATRDVMRFWAEDQARWASTLQALKLNLSAHPSRPIDLKVFYRTSAPACDAFCSPPSGAPRKPISPALLLDRSMDQNASSFSHHLVFNINDMSSSAFRAHGHGVIDFETMLGVRVDAHPGSHDGIGDKLHCNVLHRIERAQALYVILQIWHILVVPLSA